MTTPIYVDTPLAGGDLNPFAVGYIDGVDRCIQALEILLKTGTTEYFYDLSWGIPYAAMKQQSPLDTVAASVYLRARAASEPGVSSVNSCTVTQVQDVVYIAIDVTFDSGVSATGAGPVAGIGPVGVPWTWSLTGGWGGRGVVP